MSIFKTTATVTICNLENICFNSSFIPIAIIAMPPMTMAAVLAIKGGLDEKIAINSLVLGVIVSLFTITLFTSYLA